jgi:hypothetical protein
MKIIIDIIARKGLFKAPVSGEIMIGIPLRFLFEGFARKKIIEVIEKLSFDGMSLEGYAVVDGVRVDLGES